MSQVGLGRSLANSAIRCGFAALFAIGMMSFAEYAHGEGSRSLYPATYNPAGFRADLDVSDPSTLYLNVIKRSAFLYVY
ncbi:MAG TPA: hypothetical protein VJ696_12485, partial [Rhodanobacteraceae bacterium]|nr:hypothetical protein [Rhodanobacteraceae bacterium]